MCSQIYYYSYPEHISTVFPSLVDDPVAGPFVPSMFEDPVLQVDWDHAFPLYDASGTTGPYSYLWLTGCAYTDFTMPPFPTNVSYPELPSSPLSQEAPSSPLSQEAPSPQHSDGQPPPKPSCRQATSSFNHTRRKWSCSACGDFFRDKYECERHIGNVGKQAMCLACGKNVCARKDNRKRHYTKYCKRMDLGIHGGLRLEDAFVEVQSPPAWA